MNVSKYTESKCLPLHNLGTPAQFPVLSHEETL